MSFPTLMLHKPFTRSKEKDHSECLARRFEQWMRGDLTSIMQDVRYIQEKFTRSKKARSIEDTSKIFAKLIMEGKVPAALKFLDSASSGVLTCSDEVLKELKSKHQDEASIQENSLLNGPILSIPDCFFDSINEQSVMNYALKDPPAIQEWTQSFMEYYAQRILEQHVRHYEKKLHISQKNLATKSYHTELLQPYITTYTARQEPPE